MPVRITVLEGLVSARFAREISARARVMLRTLKERDAELSILLTNDIQIKKLNRAYRKKNKPTDVLAFPLRDAESSETMIPMLGDVVISMETTIRQAEKAGRKPLEEATELLAHGLLHLLGWDHDTDARDRAMRKETVRLCSPWSTSKRKRPRRQSRSN